MPPSEKSERKSGKTIVRKKLIKAIDCFEQDLQVCMTNESLACILHTAQETSDKFMTSL